MKNCNLERIRKVFFSLLWWFTRLCRRRKQTSSDKNLKNILCVREQRNEECFTEKHTKWETIKTLGRFSFGEFQEWKTKVKKKWFEVTFYVDCQQMRRTDSLYWLQPKRIKCLERYDMRKIYWPFFFIIFLSLSLFTFYIFFFNFHGI